MNQLKECPECNARLNQVDRNIQHCEICGYWTEKGTARLDTLMVFA
ncbi:hypothetical protein HWN40_07955 [Methanolobus zinderi]|uniref:Uncharacterized protein n=1 Tax=Methanolobus zinderi TaxID=536044 RepID=A0A7D5E946_9EURY|nr:hypothetical protein [Methanolobus zinderi]QLC50177.1 hypothetical protein HWN40_07955 [Methanolobus zinderi]